MLCLSEILKMPKKKSAEKFRIILNKNVSPDNLNCVYFYGILQKIDH